MKMSYNNLTNSTWNYYPPPMLTIWERNLAICLWSLLGGGNVILNTLIFLVVAKEKTFRTVGYILMLSLGWADFLSALLLFIVNPWLSSIYPEIQFEVTVYRKVGSLIVVTYTVSVGHIWVIGCSRFVATVFYSKYKTWFKDKHVYIMIIIIWILSLIAAGPAMLEFSCFEQRPDRMGFYFDMSCPYSLLLLRVNQGAAFMAVVSGIFFYTAVIQKTRKNKRLVASSRTMDRSARRGLKPEEIAITVQFFAVTIVFTGSWLIMTVYAILEESGSPLANNKFMNIFYTTIWVINFTINPYIYLVINQRLLKNVYFVLGIRFKQMFGVAPWTVGGTVCDGSMQENTGSIIRNVTKMNRNFNATGHV